MLKSALLRLLWRSPSWKNGRQVALCSTKVAAPAPPKPKVDVPPLFTQPAGQPTPHTHPHIMSIGELAPGIQATEFVERRSQLISHILNRARAIDNCPENHLIVIPGATRSYMSEKIPYVFRQNSDFYYLTGCLEQESLLVMIANGESYRTVMFMRPKDNHSELWDGPRTGVEGALDLFGVDEALPVGELESFLISYLSQNPTLVWYDFAQVINSRAHDIINNLLHNLGSFSKWESPRSIVHHMRLIKSGAEQKLMRRSCQIASVAIARTMAASKPGISEHQLFARVDYECRSMGAEYLAYPPVVAGGSRANIIHYINNNQMVADGELVLMDAGCEYHGYTSDITRTWPINGVFSDPQRSLYEALLNVQCELLKVAESQPTLDSLFRTMFNILGQRILEVGLVRQKDVPTEDHLLKAAFSFCPHHVSHYLGMDVHDTALVKQKLPLTPGMIITVEPGIYVNPKNKMANPIYHGLGMRIEDDVLVTPTGIEVLTQQCPKHPEDIEAMVRGERPC